MQDGVLYAPYVLVDWQPIVGALINHGRMAIETRVACKIPGRFKKGIQGVGFTLRFGAALWATGFIEAGVFFDG